ncbi:MAG: methionine--tRNA ligase subunit beta [Rhodococcus sp. (in: high G+C Gram-positive bacteria)]|uniref:methionine--tRNA ligase subunit beta n=1 Tax=Rhodococcus sp. TaxID=1831 RepID=UPI002ADB4456|nr:methionine--tRNA ligase subunit beta [Rhodococcus sp. (in: high G+C Gram-positive bacteria)]
MADLAAKWAAELEQYSFKQAANYFVELASWGNTYLQDQAPPGRWPKDPNDPRIADTLAVCLQITALLAQMAAPFLPFIAPTFRALVGQGPAVDGELKATLDALAQGLPILSEGHPIGDPVVLFPKIMDRNDDSRRLMVEAQKDKLATILAQEQGPVRPPVKTDIVFDDFAAMDLRTATIVAATRIPKADKLLQLTLDLGFEQRTVVSGIAEHYAPDDVVGRQVVIVANLAPRKMRGVTSQGMVLMAEDETGKLVFVSPPAGFGNGWVVR